MIVVVVGAGHRVACRHAARNDGNFLHGVAVLAELCDDGVAALVVRRDAFVRLGDESALFLRSEQNFVDPLEQLVIADHFLACAGGQDRRLVEQVFQIRARESARHAREDLEVDVGCERFVSRMDF